MRGEGEGGEDERQGKQPPEVQSKGRTRQERGVLYTLIWVAPRARPGCWACPDTSDQQHAVITVDGTHTHIPSFLYQIRPFSYHTREHHRTAKVAAKTGLIWFRRATKITPHLFILLFYFGFWQTIFFFIYTFKVPITATMWLIPSDLVVPCT